MRALLFIHFNKISIERKLKYSFIVLILKESGIDAIRKLLTQLNNGKGIRNSNLESSLTIFFSLQFRPWKIEKMHDYAWSWWILSQMSFDKMSLEKMPTAFFRSPTRVWTEWKRWGWEYFVSKVSTRFEFFVEGFACMFVLALF